MHLVAVLLIFDKKDKLFPCLIWVKTIQAYIKAILWIFIKFFVVIIITFRSTFMIMMWQTNFQTSLFFKWPDICIYSDKQTGYLDASNLHVFFYVIKNEREDSQF